MRGVIPGWSDHKAGPGMGAKQSAGMVSVWKRQQRLQKTECAAVMLAVVLGRLGHTELCKVMSHVAAGKVKAGKALPRAAPLLAPPQKPVFVCLTPTALLGGRHPPFLSFLSSGWGMGGSVST